MVWKFTTSSLTPENGDKIASGAFDDVDGKTVPVLFNFNPDLVLGSAQLSVKDEGVFAVGFINSQLGDQLVEKFKIFLVPTCSYTILERDGDTITKARLTAVSFIHESAAEDEERR